MCGCGWVFLGLGSRRTLVVTRWLRLIVKKMTCVTKKRSVLQQYWNTGTSFAPKIPRQTPSLVFFMLTCKNWAPKIGFEPCKTKKSTCLLLFWITISFGGNALAVFWSSTRPTLHNQRERRDSTHALALKRASSNHIFVYFSIFRSAQQFENVNKQKATTNSKANWFSVKIF